MLNIVLKIIYIFMYICFLETFKMSAALSALVEIICVERIENRYLYIWYTIYEEYHIWYSKSML